MVDQGAGSGRDALLGAEQQHELTREVEPVHALDCEALVVAPHGNAGEQDRRALR